jgi:hypothetical protein
MPQRLSARQSQEKPSTSRVSVPVTNEMLEKIESRAARAGVSRSAFMTRLLQYGLEAEQKKRDQFVQKIRQYRDSADPAEIERLGDEIGEMIFGQ